MIAANRISPAPTLHLNGATGSVRAGRSTFKRGRYTSLRKVLSEMKRLINKYKGDPSIRNIAAAITSHIIQDPRTGQPDMRNFKAVADAIYSWINHNIRYTRDPWNMEWLQSPDVTLQTKIGDCDDLTILAGSLLESVGIPTRLVIVKADPRYPHEYTHIYLEYQYKGQWIPFDITMHSRAGAGVSDSQIFGKKIIGLDDSRPAHLNDSPMETNHQYLGILGLKLPEIKFVGFNTDTLGKQITGALGFPKITGTKYDPNITGSGTGTTFPSKTPSNMATTAITKNPGLNTQNILKYGLLGGGVIVGGVVLGRIIKKAKKR